MQIISFVEARRQGDQSLDFCSTPDFDMYDLMSLYDLFNSKLHTRASKTTNYIFGMARPRRGVRGGGQAPVHLDEVEIEQGNEETLPPLPAVGGEANEGVLEAQRLMDNGCRPCLAYVMNPNMGETRPRDIRTVCDFLGVFPKELPGLPPDREVEFAIESHADAAPVSISPYRMAPKELKTQLQELLDRGLIRPSIVGVSPKTIH
ncbi:hypothetical protein GQ457_02G023450 [Hibiscus cannabinus]